MALDNPDLHRWPSKMHTLYESGDAYEVVRQVALQRLWYTQLRRRGKSLLVERQFRSNHYKFIHSLLEHMVRMTVVYHWLFWFWTALRDYLKGGFNESYHLTNDVLLSC